MYLPIIILFMSSILSSIRTEDEWFIIHNDIDASNLPDL